MCVPELAAPTSAPHIQRQMDPQEIAREKIKNNSCQLSEREQEDEEEEEEEEEKRRGRIPQNSHTPRPGKVRMTFGERLIRKFHGSCEVIILNLSAAHSMSKCHPGIPPPLQVVDVLLQ